MKISAIYVSPGHNFFGRHGKSAGDHLTASVAEVECVTGRGLRGDRFWDYKKDYAGQITFFDEAVHRALLRELRPTPCSPAAYRRNVITRGADLMALVAREFTVQGVRFLGIAESKPCYWMEQAVGAGAEIFLKGRGGLRAKILSDGVLRVDCPTEAGLLLVGGRSRRMGRDKAMVAWEGKTLGAHQAQTLTHSGAWPLLLGCRAEQAWAPVGFRRVEDCAAGGGVLSALVDAFAATEAEVVTVLAVDLPRVTSDMLDRIAGQAREAQVSVVPWHDGHFEPLVGAWHRSSVDELRSALSAGTSLQDVCAKLMMEARLQSFRPTGDDLDRLVNVNTPADLARLR